MSKLSSVLVCVLVLLAGCVGGDASVDSPATPTGTAPSDAGGGTAGDGDRSDAGAGSGTSGEDDLPDAVPRLRTGERYEFAVQSAVLSDAPESGTVTVDVTAGGEWPDVAMDVVRDAPSGRLAATSEAAAYSPALGEVAYALNVRSLVVTSRLVAAEPTDVRTYEVGEAWRFESSDTEVSFEVVGEERVAGLTAKHVRVAGGAETDLNADVWLVPGVGLPVKFVQTADGEATIELALTAYDRP